MTASPLPPSPVLVGPSALFRYRPHRKIAKNDARALGVLAPVGEPRRRGSVATGQFGSVGAAWRTAARAASTSVTDEPVALTAANSFARDSDETRSGAGGALRGLSAGRHDASASRTHAAELAAPRRPATRYLVGLNALSNFLIGGQTRSDTTADSRPAWAHSQLSEHSPAAGQNDDGLNKRLYSSGGLPWRGTFETAPSRYALHAAPGLVQAGPASAALGRSVATEG